MVKLASPCLVSRARRSRRAEREKESLVTLDRFPWYGGIKKRDIISKVKRKEVSALLLFDVGDQH